MAGGQRQAVVTPVLDDLHVAWPDLGAEIAVLEGGAGDVGDAYPVAVTELIEVVERLPVGGAVAGDARVAGLAWERRALVVAGPSFSTSSATPSRKIQSAPMAGISIRPTASPWGGSGGLGLSRGGVTGARLLAGLGLIGLELPLELVLQLVLRRAVCRPVPHSW